MNDPAIPRCCFPRCTNWGRFIVNQRPVCMLHVDYSFEKRCSQCELHSKDLDEQDALISRLQKKISKLDHELAAADTTIALLRRQNEESEKNLRNRPIPVKDPSSIKRLPGQKSLWLINRSLSRDETMQSVDAQSYYLAEYDGKKISIPEMDPTELVGPLGYGGVKKGQKMPRPGSWSTGVLFQSRKG